MHWLKNLETVQIQMVSSAGHFAEIDQPDRVTENILNFRLGTLGLTGIWKGDEQILIKKMRPQLKEERLLAGF